MELSKKIYTKATESVTISNVSIQGEKDASSNGHIIFGSPEVYISDVVIESGCKKYNVFEGTQTPDNKETCPKKVIMKNVVCENPDLTHNVMNIYTPADDAYIEISNCSFDINVDTTNVLRLSNIGNAKNVRVVFNNVDWTYENVNATDEDFKYAGLVLFQAYGADQSAQGDLSALKTWKFVFKNCRYDGKKVSENKLGAHDQVLYTYAIGGVKDTTDGSEAFGEILFE